MLAFEQAEDAFQHLIGDWVLELDGTAHVSTTRGADGGIDAFINRLPEQFLGEAKSSPCIVECKWNDPAAGNTDKNIVARWESVKKALGSAAAAGWVDRHAPWKRARGYLYCISGRFPNAAARDGLRQDILSFFKNLPQEQRPSIQWVEVLDWPNLRDQFDKSARLKDAWLGIDHSALRRQADYEASLKGFRRFLLNDHLPFIPPAETAASHPARILQQLDELAREQRGVLLAGAGGVGKTRTAFEVARLADAAGWRVLHATGTEGLRLDDLEGAILPSAQGAALLLCLDYLEQFTGLDLQALRTRLAAGVASRGGRLALLATARLSAAEQHGNRWSGFFHRVELQLDSAQRNRIIHSIVPVAAPEACRRYGEDAIFAVVGQRPIIALLIARAVESMHQEAGATGISAILARARTREDDLQFWLQSRLNEDRLLPGEGASPTGFLPKPVSVDSSLVAASAALAALPLVNWKLEEVAASALPVSSAEGSARSICERLSRFGWTDEYENYVHSAHDVVADEVLAGCVLDKVSGAVRSQELQRVLAAGLHMPRVLGRHAVSLTRAFQGSKVERQVAEAYAAWLRSNAGKIGMALADALPDEGGYAIGAVLGTPLAAETAFEISRDLFGPWLVRHGLRREAYHVLGRALRRPGPGDNMIHLGLGWLERYATAPEASHVLAPLLGRRDLCTDAVEDALDVAILWLRDGENGITEGASHIIKEMMRFGAKLCVRESVTLHFAACWVRVHWSHPDADFIMNRLLRRPTVLRAEWRAIAARTLLRLNGGRALEDASAAAALLARPQELRPETRHRLLQGFLRIAGKPSNLAVPLVSEARVGLSEWLTEIAHHPDGDLCSLAADICTYVEKRWPAEPKYLRGLGHLVGPALPIAARCGNSEVIERSQALARRWLIAMADNGFATWGFADAAWRFVASGAWPDAVAARRILEAMELPERVASDRAGTS